MFECLGLDPSSAQSAPPSSCVRGQQVMAGVGGSTAPTWQTWMCSGSWLQPGPAQAIVSIWRMNQRVEDLCLLVSAFT